MHGGTLHSSTNVHLYSIAPYLISSSQPRRLAKQLRMLPSLLLGHPELLEIKLQMLTGHMLEGSLEAINKASTQQLAQRLCKARGGLMVGR